LVFKLKLDDYILKYYSIPGQMGSEIPFARIYEFTNIQQLSNFKGHLF